MYKKYNPKSRIGRSLGIGDFTTLLPDSQSASFLGRFGFSAQWDEYPYASKVQGGFRATVGAVSTTQNKIAGERLQNFYRRNFGDLKGCFFTVSI